VTDPAPKVPEEIRAALVRLGLVAADAPTTGAPLTGGVSSDIWRIETPTGPICAKRALPKLKVEADWRAPVERNVYEARWLARADAAAPGATPRVLGQDAAAGVLALEWLDPARHPTWKAKLLAGRVDPGFATAVGDALGRIHAANAISRRPDIAEDFPTDEIFHAIRLEPYLAATARAWPAHAARLQALLERTARTRRALVHGDVSPKNILVGPAGPIFIDAECAWAGDPAFDLAFCLNHMLLKRIPLGASAADALAQCFEGMATAYLARVDWEPGAEIEARVATLLPALFLARVDGKSPAEYLTREEDKNRIRRAATDLLTRRPERLVDVLARWRAEP